MTRATSALPSTLSNIVSSIVTCGGGGGFTEVSGNFALPSGASSTSGIWCGNQAQLAVGLPCSSAGAWSLIYQNTYGVAGSVSNNNVWTTVETSAAAVTANRDITCSGNSVCLAANNNKGIASKTVSCSAGQYVVIHEELSIVCIAMAQFIPAIQLNLLGAPASPCVSCSDAGLSCSSCTGSFPTQGSQMVINPTFLSSAASWSLSGAWIGTVAGGVVSGGNTLNIGPYCCTPSTGIQTIGSLTVGAMYILSFYMQNTGTWPTTGLSCSLAVTIGSSSLMTTSNTAVPNWTGYSFFFKATTASMDLKFAAYNDGAGYYISNVTVGYNLEALSHLSWNLSQCLLA